ncbi:MAG: carbonic anhydrase [Myxococcaceae bacterium]|nr:carbonic anhydrase [Myxococcaceae bacterium]
MSQLYSKDSIPPAEALQRLKEGNTRFVGGALEQSLKGWRPGLGEGQRPFAVVIGCSDSRSPAELVFDQGLGALFVVRVAGNVIAPSGVGSVEFAAAQFGTRLVVVMGHTRCGAISATCDIIRNGDSAGSANLRSITDRIRPQVEDLVRLEQEAHVNPELVLRHATYANARSCADRLRHGSTLIETLVQQGWLHVVPAVYDLDTGNVEFLERIVPQGA